MAQVDNELTTLSRHVSALEVALHEYAFSPREGLNKLQTSLTSFQMITQSEISNGLFHEQLVVCLSAVESLLAAGAVYSKEHQLALLEATDALLQFSLVFQFDIERAQQLVTLLSRERTCWRALSGIVQETSVPDYLVYEGLWEGSSFHGEGLEFYLEQLAGLGRVTFHLDSIQMSKVRGHFSLLSAQSIGWLKQRFPMFRWKRASNHGDDSLRELFELVYFLFLQSSGADKYSRRRLLDAMEYQVKSSFYREFAGVLPADFKCEIDGNRLVPALSDALVPNFDRSLTAFPIRDGGRFYVGLQEQGASDFNYLTCLGRDILPSFLYVIQTRFGSLAFDQVESLGGYSVSQDDFKSIGAEWFFYPESGIAAKLILELPLSLSVGGVTLVASLLEDVTQVLVVRQHGMFFALPYFDLSEMEGFCALARTNSAGVKNVWLSLSNDTVLEPWLAFSLSSNRCVLSPVKNKSTTYSKNGYYLGEVDGVSFLVEARLVSKLLPYQGSDCYFYVDNNGANCYHFMVHEGQSFFQVLPLISDDSCQDCKAVDKSKFSAVLEWMGESVVLHLDSCDWGDAFSEVECIQEFKVSQESNVDGNGLDDFTSWRGKRVLLNNENYLSFVRTVWPPASLA